MTETIGPLFSHLGFRTWDIWLQPGLLVAIRHDVHRTIRLSARRGVGHDQPVEYRELDPRDLRIPTETIARIVLFPKAMLFSELHVETRDQAVRKFGVFDVRRISDYEQALHTTYPGLDVEYRRSRWRSRITSP